MKKRPAFSLKKFILILALGVLLSSCNVAPNEDEEGQATNEKPAVQKEETEEELAQRLAGGKLGSDSIAFIGGGTSNKIWVADAKYHKMLTAIEVEGPKLERTQPYYPNLHDVHAMVFSNDFEVMYTVNWYDYDEPSEVIAYDPKTFNELWRSEAGLGGHHAALSPDNKYLFVANQYADTVSVIDTETRQKVKDITTGMGNDYISPIMYWNGEVIDSPYLFVSVHDGGRVFAIDWEALEVVKELTFGGMVHGVNLSPDGKYAWAAVMNENIVPVIDVETLEVVHTIETEQSPIHLSFSPDGQFVYFTTFGDQIYKYNTETYEQVWNVTGTSIPAHTGVSPDGRELWTLNHAMDNNRYPYQLGGSIAGGIQIWDTEDGSLINEMPAHGTPHEMQFVPYSAVGALDIPEEIDEAEPNAQAINSYRQSCLACHGANLEGASGPSLEGISERYTVEEIENIIKHGQGSMPGGLVSDEEAELIAEWLHQVE
ncbi:MAG: c-type cytochrome [Anaerobacillus sp.]|uniref:c-type cytochrome n=1 Tax=Anaerobacillus sp. TaxID=1872506 RepID=UPI00391A485C